VYRSLGCLSIASYACLFSTPGPTREGHWGYECRLLTAIGTSYQSEKYVRIMSMLATFNEALRGTYCFDNVHARLLYLQWLRISPHDGNVSRQGDQLSRGNWTTGWQPMLLLLLNLIYRPVRPMHILRLWYFSPQFQDERVLACCTDSWLNDPNNAPEANPTFEKLTVCVKNITSISQPIV
jgi:hypothetical protein